MDESNGAAGAKPGRTGRRFKIVIGAVVALGVIWSAGWYAVTRYADKWFDRLDARIARDGGTLTCGDRALGGYPFKLTLGCAPAAIDFPARKLSLRLGALETVALIYNPGHVLGAAKGPLALSTPAGIDVSADWAKLESSARFGTSRLQRASAIADGLTVGLTSSAVDLPVRSATLAHGEAHGRINPDDAGAVDVAGSADGLVVTLADGRVLPPVATELSATLPGLAGALQSGGDVLAAWLASGGAAKIGAASITVEGFSAVASGPLSLSQDGLLSGKLTIRVDGLEKLPDAAEAILPGSRDKVMKGIGPLALLLQPTTIDGKTWRQTTLTIRNGAVSAGILPLGHLPRIRLPGAGGS